MQCRQEKAKQTMAGQLSKTPLFGCVAANQINYDLYIRISEF